MRTKTRSEILKIIEKNGEIRPFDLRKSLQISAVAIHRHLRNLMQKGLIETRGSNPFTRYALTGMPDFEAVAHWMNARSSPKGSESLVCETREIFAARLPRLKTFVKNGLPENVLPL